MKIYMHHIGKNVLSEKKQKTIELLTPRHGEISVTEDRLHKYLSRLMECTFAREERFLKLKKK